MSIPVQAVFCDVGGPIYDDENFVAAVLTALDELREREGKGPVDRVRFRLIYNEVRADQRKSLRSELAQEFLGATLRRVELHELTRKYWVHPPGTMYQDVLPFFRRLAGRVKIGLLANQEKAVIDAVKRDGLDDFVDVWGVSAIVGFEKPSAEIFRWCLDQALVPADAAVHIGNRLDTDIRPARALGLHTVWLLRGEAPDEPTASQLAEPDLVVHSLDGLADRLLADDPFPIRPDQ